MADNLTEWNLSIGKELIGDAFLRTEIGGFTYIVPLMVILLSLFLVTRDMNKWKTLFFPMSIAWYIVGLDVHLLILIVAGLIFAISSISLELISDIIESSAEVIRERRLSRGERTKFKSLITETKALVKERRAKKAIEQQPLSEVLKKEKLTELFEVKKRE